MHTLYKKIIFISCSKIFTKSYEVKILRHKNCNKNEKKRHVLLLPHMRIAALLMPDASVCFCVQAGRTARSESSARTPANAHARNWNSAFQVVGDVTVNNIYLSIISSISRSDILKKSIVCVYRKKFSSRLFPPKNPHSDISNQNHAAMLASHILEKYG